MVSTKKILITGASGYLGQHFLAGIRSSDSDISGGIQVYALYRSVEGFEEAVKGHKEVENHSNTCTFHLLKLDITNKNEVDAFMDTHGPFDLCFHLAALSSPRVCHEDPDKARAINVPIHLFHRLRDTQMVALSTDQVYCGTKAPYDDDSPPATPPVNVYAGTKVEMESLLLNNGDGSKRTMPAICLRSSIILGPLAPYGNAHSTFLHFCKSREGQQTTFYTDEIRSVIAVHDVVNILLHFMKDGVSDSLNSDQQNMHVYNMGGPQRVSRMDMAEAVAKEIGFPAEGYFVAARKADEKPSSDGVRAPLDISMNSSKLENLVGFKFKGLDEVVKATFD